MENLIGQVIYVVLRILICLVLVKIFCKIMKMLSLSHKQKNIAHETIEKEPMSDTTYLEIVGKRITENNELETTFIFKERLLKSDSDYFYYFSKIGEKIEAKREAQNFYKSYDSKLHNKRHWCMEKYKLTSENKFLWISFVIDYSDETFTEIWSIEIHAVFNLYGTID